MKRKLTTIVSLLMAGIILLCGCSSGDGQENSYELDFSRPSGENSTAVSSTASPSEEQDFSSSITPSGVYYVSIYDEDIPMNEDLAIIDLVSETRANLTYTRSFVSITIDYNYSVDNGKFNASTVTHYVTSYPPLSGDFSADGEELYLNQSFIRFDAQEGKYVQYEQKVKYVRQSALVLEGKYELLGEPAYSNSAVSLEFNGDEMTITKHNGEVEKFYYEISAQNIVYKENKDDSKFHTFKMYGYTKDHLFANIQHPNSGSIKDYDEFRRID